MSSLIGKSLAVVSDARFSGGGVQTIIERLLSISGEDAIDVDRKNKPIWNGRLGTRFMILTNKVPELGDASGAIASRFLVLEMALSWLGQEDRDLEARLMAELPGILFWALDGMFELDDLDQFTVPESSAEEIACSDLYLAWKDWCEDNGRRFPESSARFGRDLRSAGPGITGHSRGPDGKRIRTYGGIGLDPLYERPSKRFLPTAADMRTQSEAGEDSAS
jgi:putative DNA primase/helicase